MSTPVLALLIALLAAAVYWPGLSGDFLFDDYPNIVTNERVHLEALDAPSLTLAARGYEPGEIGRPLPALSFALNYYVGGKHAWGYKFINLLVHVLNALLVFALVSRLFGLSHSDDQTPLPAFAVALLWAIHPLQISTVLYVVQRMEILAATSMLLGLLAYLHGRVKQQRGERGWPWLTSSAVLAATGLLSKETAVLFPVFALALELGPLRFGAVRSQTARFLRLAFGAGVAVALLVFLLFVLPRYGAVETYAGRDFDLAERLLSQLRVLPMYLGQMLLPLPGSMPFYYDAWPKSTGWLEPPTTLLGGVFLLALLGAAWRARARMPLFALGVFWFFGAHLLTSNVISLELAFEHRNYFALLGVLLAIADLIRRIPMRDGPALKYTAVALVVVAFGFLGTIRAATWGDPLRLAMDLVAKAPKSSRASSDLATLYIGMSNSNPDSPFFDLGRREFERGSRLPNASPLPEQGLILMAATTGRPVDDAWWQRLIQKLRTRPVSTESIMAVTGLMEQRYRGIPLDDRRLSVAYATMLGRAEMPAHLYAQYGDFALTHLHDGELATRMFIEAVDRAAADPGYAGKIVGALLADGHVVQAKAVMAHTQTIGVPQVGQRSLLPETP
ncbi:MAG TPA: hypothetical protein VFF71_09290 [Luteimonas sp.]|nr:hypothetical protein [Luteimonas sp.]